MFCGVDDAMISWRQILRHLSVTRIFLFALGFSTLSFIVLAYFVSQKPSSPSHPPPTLLAPDLSCLDSVHHAPPADIHSDQTGGHVRTEPRVLLVVETPYTRLGQAIVVILESVRFKHRVQVTLDIFVDCN